MEFFRVMKVTKPDGRQWNTILNLVLSSLCFDKHVIYYALYIGETTSTKYILIFGYYKDEFLSTYSTINIFKDLLAGINNYLPVTSKEVPWFSHMILSVSSVGK